MHIKEIVLDGFKSYARRTVVSGFDPKFNAITGLNGSGKSNILDSICFVLGISNLTQVRVRNLQELVYKQGQAGVTKASVAIVFDNADKASSPVGYEHYDEITITRQIVIGGRNKYMINGHSVQANQVQNLFHSVQLNVNNPHFLIMQGRITKVLNMKPPEILGMIEEAAGTRMYETKKQAAIKTMEKKQGKVDEINRILTEEITPTLEKLRGEKGHYLQWSANNAEIARLEKFCTAHDYVRAKHLVSQGEEDQVALDKEVSALRERIAAQKAEVAELTSESERLTKHREAAMEDSFRAAETRERELAKELVELNSRLSNKQKMERKQQKASSKAANDVAKCKGQIALKQEELEQLTAAAEALSARAEQAAADVERAETALANMHAGIAEDAGAGAGADGGSLTERIASAAAEATRAGSAASKAQLRIEHLNAEVTELRAKVRKAEKAASSLQKKRDAAQRMLSEVEERLQGMEYDAERGAALEEERSALEARCIALRETVEGMEAALAGRLAFEFKDPSKNFDRSKVKGLVARLVTVRDMRAAGALEVCAGGKLYQVVVDSAATGKALLERGKLRRRVTIIPLDKVSPRVVEQRRLRTAKAVAERSGARCDLALELVGYDEELRAAMEYVFGASLVCSDQSAAKTIAFHAQVRQRTVTYDGDVFDPSGAMTGGSSAGGTGQVLRKLQELNARSRELADAQARLRGVSAELASCSDAAAVFAEHQQELDLRQHKLKLLDEQLETTTHAVLQKRLADASNGLSEARRAAEDALLAQEQAQQRHEALRAEEQRYAEAREAAVKGCEDALGAAKKAAAAADEERGATSQRTEELALELQNLEAELQQLVGDADAVAKALAELSSGIEEAVAQRDEKAAEWKAADEALAEQRTDLQQANDAINGVLSKVRELQQNIDECQIDEKRASLKAAAHEKEVAAATEVAASLETKFPWITEDEKLFGVAGTDYDFEASDPSAAKRRAAQLQKEQAKLGRNINKKVMGMIEQAEAEYTDLMRKRSVIENDKAKIEAVIGDLDIRKNAAVQRTWEKVNRDFGSIFSTLLPGTSAKLDPPEGGTVLDGLEVKVAFGAVWKQSLSELSGGQRSLLALSLILAMLLFKPAPMYILDEVDAALDLSHTQNIGTMLRTHFQSSQFVVVSLKEGMFNNANVIFRTRFLDGVSTVQRTIGDGASMPASENAAAAGAGQENGEPAVSRVLTTSKKRARRRSVAAARALLD